MVGTFDGQTKCLIHCHWIGW